MIIKRGQSSIEFFVLVGAVLFFFVTFLLAIQANIADNIRAKIEISLREAALSVQDEIALASASSDGYTRYFLLPNEIEGIGYEINIVEDSVYARIEDRYALALPVFNVTGDVQKGDNLIRKSNGAVYLNS